MLPNLDFTKPICVDLETISFNKSRGGLDPFNGDKIGMVAIAQGDKAYSYLLRSNVARSSCVPFEEFKKEFSEWLLEVQHLVNQNIKFDLRFLHCEGYKLRKDVKLEDTMVLARIRRNDMPEYNLDYLTHRFCKKYKKI